MNRGLKECRALGEYLLYKKASQLSVEYKVPADFNEIQSVATLDDLHIIVFSVSLKTSLPKEQTIS